MYRGFNSEKQKTQMINIFHRQFLTEEMNSQILLRAKNYKHISKIENHENMLMIAYDDSQYWQSLDGKIAEKTLKTILPNIYHSYKLLQNGFSDFDRDFIYIHEQEVYLVDYGLNTLVNIQLEQQIYHDEIYNSHTKTWLFGLLIIDLLFGKQVKFNIQQQVQQSGIDQIIYAQSINNRISNEFRDQLLKIMKIDNEERMRFEELQQLQYLQLKKDLKSLTSRNNAFPQIEIDQLISQATKGQNFNGQQSKRPQSHDFQNHQANPHNQKVREAFVRKQMVGMGQSKVQHIGQSQYSFANLQINKNISVFKQKDGQSQFGDTKQSFYNSKTQTNFFNNQTQFKISQIQENKSEIQYNTSQTQRKFDNREQFQRQNKIQLEIPKTNLKAFNQQHAMINDDESQRLNYNNNEEQFTLNTRQSSNIQQEQPPIIPVLDNKDNQVKFFNNRAPQQSILKSKPLETSHLPKRQDSEIEEYQSNFEKQEQKQQDLSLLHSNYELIKNEKQPHLKVREESFKKKIAQHDHKQEGPSKIVRYSEQELEPKQQKQDTQGSFDPGNEIKLSARFSEPPLPQQTIAVHNKIKSPETSKQSSPEIKRQPIDDTKQQLKMYSDYFEQISFIGRTVSDLIEKFNGNQTLWVVPLFLIFKVTYLFQFFQRMVQIRTQAYQQIKNDANCFSLQNFQHLVKSKEYHEMNQNLQTQNDIIMNELKVMLQQAQKTLPKLDQKGQEKMQPFLDMDLSKELRDQAFTYLYQQLLKKVQSNINKFQVGVDNKQKYSEFDWVQLKLSILIALNIMEFNLFQIDFQIYNIKKFEELVGLQNKQFIEEWCNELENKLSQAKQRVKNRGFQI
ncbi:hypothetical protein pb186bvf_006886 [Paramecium bursaria]